MSRLSEFLTSLAPGLAARYWSNRLRASVLMRGYEAAVYSPHHPRRGTGASPDATVGPAGMRLRNHARWLDENHDLAIGVLDTLVNKTVGEEIRPEPMIKFKDGRLHADANDAVREMYTEWARAPDAVGELPMGELQRLEVRTFLRDGESFTQHIEGAATGYPYRTPVPYVFELIEADLVPLDLNDPRRRIVQGVQKDRWGRPIGYHVLRSHPGNTGVGSAFSNTVFVAAQNITHLKMGKRLNQTRGISVFHGVLRRLDDIKDYEESERIAARVASAFTAVITKDPAQVSAPTDPSDTSSTSRSFEMTSGMILDNLLPGEKVETVSSDRPNTGLADFRASQLRAVGSGTGTGYSNIANEWSGSYTAERQQAAEKDIGYKRIHNLYVSVAVSRRYRRFVELAIISGALKLPSGINRDTLFDAEYSRPAMAWVDQLKEVKGEIAAVEAGLTSRAAIIRKRGGDQRVIDSEIEADEFVPTGKAPAGTSDRPAPDAQPGTPPAAPPVPAPAQEQAA